MVKRTDSRIQYARWRIFFLPRVSNKGGMTAAAIEKAIRQLECCEFMTCERGDKQATICLQGTYFAVSRRVERLLDVKKNENGQTNWTLQLPEEHADATSVQAPTAVSMSTQDERSEVGTPGMLTLALLCDDASVSREQRSPSKYVFGEDIFQGAYSVVRRASTSHSSDTFAAKLLPRESALREIAAYAAVPRHRALNLLLDVDAVDMSNVALIFPQYRCSLEQFIGRQPLQTDETKHVAKMLLHGLAHLHSHGLQHGDFNPSNVLIRGRSLREVPNDAEPELARGILALDTDLQVVISDLGHAVPGSVERHTAQAVSRILQRHRDSRTLTYAPPEITSGTSDSLLPTFAMDMWALGATLASCMRGLSLLSVNAASLLHSAANETPGWLQEYPGAADFLARLQEMDPQSRLTAHEALLERYVQPPRFEVIVDQAICGRGPTTIVKATMDARSLQLAQADPYLHTLCEKLYGKIARRAQCWKEKETEENMKYEEAGYPTEDPPRTKVVATLPCKHPLGAEDLGDWLREFLEINDPFWETVTAAVQQELAELPQRVRGENGQDFMTTHWRDMVGKYGVLQAMLPSEPDDLRTDPEHYDGGASQFHMGVTLHGCRNLHFICLGESLYQRPGDVYIGNMCAVKHEVRHLHPRDAEPLYKHEDHCGEGEGALVTCMVRSDMFAASYARQLSKPPSPALVYEIVNKVFARELSRNVVLLPTWAAVRVRVAARHAQAEQQGPSGVLLFVPRQ